MAKRFLDEVPLPRVPRKKTIPPTRRRNYEVNDSTINDYGTRLINEAANINQQQLQQNRQRRNSLRANLEYQTNNNYPFTDIQNQQLINDSFIRNQNYINRQQYRKGGKTDDNPVYAASQTYNRYFAPEVEIVDRENVPVVMFNEDIPGWRYPINAQIEQLLTSGTPKRVIYKPSLRQPVAGRTSLRFLQRLR